MASQAFVGCLRCIKAYKNLKSNNLPHIAASRSILLNQSSKYRIHFPSYLLATTLVCKGLKHNKSTRPVIKNRYFSDWRKSSSSPWAQTTEDALLFLGVLVIFPWVVASSILLFTITISSPEVVEIFPQLMNHIKLRFYASEVAENLSTGTSQALSDDPLYSTLQQNEFRLLLLEPGKAHEPVRCRLIRCSHLEKPYYQALSYVWGDPSEKEMINCNDHVMGVTRNLHSALLHLRQPRHPRLLWIDALCINQDNTMERTQQVQAMQQIFAMAQEVIIWLGDDANLLIRCIQALRTPSEGKIYKFHMGLLQHLGIYPSPEFRFRQSYGSNKWNKILIGYNFQSPFYDDLALTPSELDDLSTLLEQPWFTRLWVIQEIAYAKRATIMCGRSTSNWMPLADIIARFFNSGIISKNCSRDAIIGAEAIVEMNRLRRQRVSMDRLGLRQVLLATNAAKCSDLRDKVYGVLSLAGDYNPRIDAESFKPEYDIGPSMVFKRLAQWSLDQGDTNILACTARRGGKSTPGLDHLPTWAPDWTNIDNPKPFVMYSNHVPFCAGRVQIRFQEVDKVQAIQLASNEKLHDLETLDNLTTLSIHEDVLTIRGAIVDKVRAVGQLMPYNGPANLMKLPHNIQSQQDWVQECERLSRMVPTRPQDGESNTVWKTLTAGLTGEGHEAPYIYETWFEEYKEYLKDRQSGLKPIYTKQIAAIEASISLWPLNRRFAVTTGGRLALVPNGARQGDVVALFSTVDVPLILRPVLRTGEYNIIGEAFVDYFMWGREVLVPSKGASHPRSLRSGLNKRALVDKAFDKTLRIR